METFDAMHRGSEGMRRALPLRLPRAEVDDAGVAGNEATVHDAWPALEDPPGGLEAARSTTAVAGRAGGGVDAWHRWAGG